jgi:hypothetical protein
VQEKVTPRLLLEQVDTLVDEGILRLIEGMETTIDCDAYQFMDSRDDGDADQRRGVSLVLRALAKMHYKTRYLEKILRRQYPFRSGATAYPLMASREDLEARKRQREEKAQQDKQETARKNEQRAKYRDFERSIKSIREAFAKSLKRRRDEARLRVEVVCDREEESKRTGGGSEPMALDAAAAGASLSAAALMQRAQQRAKSPSVLAAAGPGPTLLAGTPDAMAAGDLNPALRPPRPEPERGCVPFDGEAFGQALELWGFLTTFAAPLKIRAMPSLDHFVNALKATDPTYRHLSLHARGALRSFEAVNAQCAAHARHARAAPAGGASRVGERPVAMAVGVSPDMPSPEAAHHVLAAAATSLTEPLRKEFYKLLGIDQVEGSLEELSVPINALTWREVVRITLLGNLAKEVRMLDADVHATVRGRGFTTSPETLDKKALKLARKRIRFVYDTRDENQEALYGFRSGLVVRLPAPGPTAAADADWRQLIGALEAVPADSGAWLVQDVIATAALQCARGGTHPQFAAALQAALRSLLQAPCVRPNDAAETKRRALSYLRLPVVDRLGRKLKLKPLPTLADGPSSSSSSNSSSSASVIDTAEEASSPIADDCGFNLACARHAVGADGRLPSPSPSPPSDAVPHALARVLEEAPHTVFAFWARQNEHVGVRHAPPERRRYGYGMDVPDKDPNAEEGEDFVQDDSAMIVDDDGALKPSASTAAAAAAPAVAAAAGPEGAEGDEASPPKRRGRGGARVKGVRMPKEPKAPRVMMMDAAGAGAAAAAGGEDEEGYTIDALGRRRGGNMHRDPSTGHFLRKPQPGLDPEAHITDAHLFDTLPVAAQRCYLILRDLMSHPLAPPFNFPVDRADYPSYYRIVAQAVAFSDIRHHLVTGGYHHALTHFYSDVILVLENAVAYNPENHALNAAAQKLAVVFERMFLETVLSYDHPLPFTDSCHFCRGHEPCVVDKKHIQCERCEAFHHIKCLAAREKLYARQVLALRALLLRQVRIAHNLSLSLLRRSRSGTAPTASSKKAWRSCTPTAPPR